MLPWVRQTQGVSLSGSQAGMLKVRKGCKNLGKKGKLFLISENFRKLRREIM